MRSEPEIQHLRNWFVAERRSGYGTTECIKIADFVQSGKRYTEAEKLEFVGRKATVQFTAGRDMRYTDTAKALEFLKAALRSHLFCFTVRIQVGHDEAR